MITKVVCDLTEKFVFRRKRKWYFLFTILQMIDECMKTIDDHQTFFYMEMVSDCWLFLRLQFLTSIFIGVLSLAIVMNKDTMGANLAGLSLTSAITVMQDVFLFARYAATLEKAMVSMERVKEYEDIIQVLLRDKKKRSLIWKKIKSNTIFHELQKKVLTFEWPNWRKGLFNLKFLTDFGYPKILFGVSDLSLIIVIFHF